MLDILRNAVRIAMPPVRINFIMILQLPVGEYILTGIQSRLFTHFAYGRVAQGFHVFTTAGNRLPVIRMIGAFQQQHLRPGPELSRRRSGIDHHQYRNRLFFASHAYAKNTQNGLLRCRQYTTVSSKISCAISRSLADRPSVGLTLRNSNTYPGAARHDKSHNTSTRASQFAPNSSGYSVAFASAMSRFFLPLTPFKSASNSANPAASAASHSTSTLQSSLWQPAAAGLFSCGTAASMATPVCV